jgi:hypothetical protein
MRRRIKMVTSSSNEISTDKLGKMVVVREGGVTLPPPLFTAGFWTNM